MKKIMKVLLVSTLLFGSYLFLEDDADQNSVYAAGDTQINNEDHPEY